MTLFWICRFSSKELDRDIVVRLDPADLGRRENDNGRFFLGEKILDRLLVA